MHKLATTFVCIGLLAATAALAGPPIPGNYQSTDMGGAISTGRYTEGWFPGGGALLPGTTLNAESWNGAALGTEWKYSCATEVAPAVLIHSTVNASGFGQKTYMKQFVGGRIWLSGTGPWANGDVDYPGTIDSYTEFETIQYSNFLPVAAVTNVSATAHFDAYPAACMTFAIANGSQVGSTAWGMTPPANYPAFLDGTTCAAGAPEGAWWNMLTLTLSVSSGCATPTKASSWGSLKAMYR